MDALNNPASELLFVVLKYPAQGDGHGLRVFQDGRYESLNNVTWHWTDSNQPVPTKIEPSWQPIWQFKPDELQKLHTLIKESGVLDLPREIKAKTPVSDGTEELWTFWTDHEQVKIQIQPGAQPAEITRFWDGFNKLRPVAKQYSTWSVWDGSQQLHRKIIGNASAVPQLRGLIRALYLDGPAPSDDPIFTFPPEDIPLITVTWHSEDALKETNSLSSQGQFTRIVGDGEPVLSEKSTVQVQRVIKAISDIDWDALPETIQAN